MTDPLPDPEPVYRTLTEWAATLGLDEERVAALLAFDRGLRPGDTLTFDELRDLVGLAALVRPFKDPPG